MSDETFDPWKSLASELGVDPNAVPPPPPPPPAPVASSFSPSFLPPEHKKAPADWRALASDLGIEVPPEPETPITRKDPVAELLGWPAQSRAPEPREREAFDAGDSEDQPWDAEDVPTRWKNDDDEKPLAEDEATSQSHYGRREDRGGDREDGPRRGRRRRGGRGRGQRAGGRQRSDENRGINQRSEREPRRPMSEGYGADDSWGAPPAGEVGIPDDEELLGGFDENQDRAEKPADEDEQGHRGRRRRGRRRGRNGDRSGSERGSRRNQRSGGRPVEETSSKDTADTFGEDLDDIDDLEHIDGLPSDDDAHLDELADTTNAADDEDEHQGKHSVRDIMTWKEAIGVIIDTNMQERTRNPRQGNPRQGNQGHGGHGGRGRRGGRRNG